MGFAAATLHLALEGVLHATPDNRFTLEEVPPAVSSGEVEPALRQSPHLDLDGIARAHAAATTAAYCWNVSDDSITWSSNASEVLQCDVRSITSGRRFADFLDSNNITSRYDTVVGAGHRDALRDGVAFEIEYSFRPAGRGSPQAVWVEDCGRWYGTADQGPAVVYGTMRVVNQRHIRDQELNFLANRDNLTGMMNRGRMMKTLDEAITVARAEKGACAFAILAVNNLGTMNETYGYEVADEVISAIAEKLRKVMRVGDAIARYSRSKFGIILNGCGPAELPAALERFMRATRDNVIETPLGPVWAMLSVGAVNLPGSGSNATTAAACAEEALAEALAMPGDSQVIYQSDEFKSAQRLLNARCASEIVSCLRERRFILALQPVRDAATGEAAFHEALLRLRDSTGEIVTASHLVPVAENLGLIRLIDRAVTQMALSMLAQHPSARLSINLSATTVMDPRWNTQILDILASAPELSSRLIVEIPEAAALDGTSTASVFINALHKTGCAIAIDDFGAGLTTYRNLKSLPARIIKLDGSLCRNLGHAEGHGVYVKSMVELAHAHGAMVVAVRVETEQDAASLAALGVDLIQGNLLGEPSFDMPWEKAESSESLAFAETPSQLEALAPDDASLSLPVQREDAPESEATQEADAQSAVTVEEAAVAAAGDLAAAPDAAPEVASDGEPVLELDFDTNLKQLRELLQSLQSVIGERPASPDEPGDVAQAS